MENIDRQMATRTLEESAGIFREIYGIPGTVPEIVAGMIDMVREDSLFPSAMQTRHGAYHPGTSPAECSLYIATATIAI